MPVFEENRDVLSRKENKVQLNLTDSKLNTILQFIAAVGHPTKISYLWRPNLRDEADNMANRNTLTIRIPQELKDRIETLAAQQGISINQFAMYTRKCGKE
jgi:predicted HicB family RNase H-like nuclease